jgi:hypothetical protein
MRLPPGRSALAAVVGDGVEKTEVDAWVGRAERSTRGVRRTGRVSAHRRLNLHAGGDPANPACYTNGLLASAS